MTARERLAAWLEVAIANMASTRRPLDIAYESAPLYLSDLDQLYIENGQLAHQRAAALELHRKAEGWHQERGKAPEEFTHCAGCFGEEWPCPTVVALGGGQ